MAVDQVEQRPLQRKITLTRDEMEAVLASGGSVLIHPRDENGDVNGFGMPLTSLDQLPDAIQLGKYQGDAAMVDAGKADLQKQIDELQAKLKASEDAQADAEADKSLDPAADYAALTNFPQKKAWARAKGIAFNNSSVKGEELDTLVQQWKDAQGPEGGA